MLNRFVWGFLLKGLVQISYRKVSAASFLLLFMKEIKDFFRPAS